MDPTKQNFHLPQETTKKFHELFHEELELLLHEEVGRFFSCRKHESNCQNGREKCKSFVVPGCKTPCEWTGQPSRKTDANVFFFHGDIKQRKHPRRQYADQLFIVFGHEPTEVENPQKWLNETWVEKYDATIHWATGADVPVNFFYMDEWELGRQRARNWWKRRIDEQWSKKMLQAYLPFSDAHDYHQRPISAMVKLCKTGQRYEILEQIMKEVPTSSYGLCLNNEEGDAHEWTGKDKTLLMRQKIRFLKRHPFYLALESVTEAGFVTEKIFQAFLAGSIPIYYGPREVFDMVPSGSFIFVEDYPDIHALAKHIEDILNDYDLFLSYHAWRQKDETDAVFDRLLAHSRTNVLCRVCTFYADHYQDIAKGNYQSNLRYTPKRGWFRI